MLFKPPLTRKPLHDIGVRKGPQDIVELLWEINRLRALALKIDQAQRSITVSGGMSALLESLREDRRNEPCVQEDDRIRINLQSRHITLFLVRD